MAGSKKVSLPEESYLDRRSELLYLARKTRLQWITSAESPQGVGGVQSASNIVEMESLMSALPATKCLDDVLKFLTEVSGDEEAVTLASLVNAELFPDDDESDQLPDCTGMDAYSALVKKLKRQSSTDIVKSMQSFVQGIEIDLREANYSESIEDKLDSVSKSIWIYLKKLFGMMRDNVCWSEEADADWELTKVNIERFLFTKLHRTLFIEDSVADEELFERVQTLSFLSPEHLDIRSIINVGSKMLDEPVTILRDSLSVPCHPAGKIHVLRECCAAISRNLSRARGDGSHAGADEFLPVLILVIKEANPRQLKSNMRYITQFTNPSKLASEAGYLLTQFVSAVQFLETVDASALTISPLEFEVAVSRCRAEARRLNVEFRSKADKIAIVDSTAVSAHASVKKECQKQKHKKKCVDGNTLMMQRRKYAASAFHLRSTQPVARTSSRPSSAVKGALLRALDRYDSDVHGEMVRDWCGVVDERRGSVSANRYQPPSSVTNSLQVLNYVSAQTETLSVAELPKLLAEYKMLVKICAVLISERTAF